MSVPPFVTPSGSSQPHRRRPGLGTLIGLCACLLAQGLGAQPTLLLHYDFNSATTPYANLGTLSAPLTPRGNYQSPGAPGSGVSGLPEDRAWDSSANTTQGVATPANNAAVTTPATGLDLSTLSGFTVAFWFKTQQSMNSDAATRLVYKANTAAGDVAQGMTLRSLSGALELRAGTTNGSVVVSSLDFGSGSGYNRVNSWIFVAMTWDGSTVQFYCGGPDYRLVNAGGGPMTGKIVNYTGNLVLGNSGSFNRGLDGWIDNFRFYDGPLSAAELELMRQQDANVTGEVELGGPLRPLAPDYSVLDEADAGEVLVAPQIVRLPSGRLVATWERRLRDSQDEAGDTVLATSDDGGDLWTTRASWPIGSARLLNAASGLYVIGLKGDLAISRSTDSGQTWSELQTWSTGLSWHRSPGNVWTGGSKVALAWMARSTSSRDGWNAADFAPVLWVAPDNLDLRSQSSWKHSASVSFGEVFSRFGGGLNDGTYFGVPFRMPPGGADLSTYARLALTPLGWSDPQVARITDPANIWYDGTGRTWHLVMRGHTGGTNYAGLLKVVEQGDGSLVAQAETVPSGRTQIFVPLSGGDAPFSLLYDSVSDRHWLLSQPALDSLRQPPAPDTLARGPWVLSFSINLVDWVVVAVVADPGLTEPRLAVDNVDLVVIGRLETPGEPDRITVRRVRGFRDMIY